MTGGGPSAWRGSLWQPSSACGPDCYPVAGEVTGPLRRAVRLVALLGALLLGGCLLPVLPVLSASGRQTAGRRGARVVLRALGVELAVTGSRLPRRRALLVANHISWLDVVAVLAVAPTRMVAKREVRRWPVIGALAAAAGTIFVDRSRPRALPATVAEVATALGAGSLVTVFPEGTTWCGRPGGGGCGGAGRFRPAMFQAAVDAGAVVVPLTLAYRAGPGGPGTTAAAFLGDDTLWASLRRVLAVRHLVVSVTVAPALHPEPGAGRRPLARIAESAVARAVPSGGATRPARRGVLAMYRVIVTRHLVRKARHAPVDDRRPAAAHPG